MELASWAPKHLEAPDGATTAAPPAGSAKQGETAAPHELLYSSVSFQGKEGEIRLIELLPGQGGQDIKARLFVVDNVTSQPYEALSYVWGSREHDVTISVNGMALDISLNLADALRCLRPPQGAGRILWIDAICINQASNAEKGSQVALMGHIYRSASDVVIFLGEEADDSDLVMDYLEFDDPDPSVVAPAPQRPNPIANSDEDDLVRNKIWLYGLDGPRLLRAAHAFFARAYWSRIWVVQESGLARRPPDFYCGRRRVVGERFRSGLKPLFTHLVAESNPLTGDPAVSLSVNSKDDKFAQDDRRWNITFGVLHNSNKIGKRERPSQVLIRLARRQSTDPRDQVFAMRELVDPVMRNLFLPDYETEPTELFARLTAYLLVCDDSSITYSYFAVNGTRKDPSWALNFTLPFPWPANGFLSDYKEKASWMKETGCLSICNGILGVTGTVVDILETVVLLEDTTDDLQRIEKFWNSEGLLQKGRPSEPLSEEALIAVASTNCVVPLDRVAQLGQCFATATIIPGAHQYQWEVQERMFLDFMPWINSKNCTCAAWAIPPVLNQAITARTERRAALYVKSADSSIVDAFFPGAIFDLENLKQQIMSVQFSQRTASQSNNEQDISRDLASLNLNQGNISSSQRCPRAYDQITAILRSAESREELSELQKLACLLASRANKTLQMYMTSTGSSDPSQGDAVEYEGPLSRHLQEYRNISRNCTCPGISRQQHRDRLQLLINSVKEKIRKMKEDRRKAEGALRLGARGYAAMYAMYASERKRFSAMFVTKHGFVGMVYQRGHGLKAGDSLVVLDGVPPPVVLESTRNSGIDRMKTSVHVVGLTDIDMGKMIELGIFKRRDFKIM
jgi:hypothetical protein